MLWNPGHGDRVVRVSDYMCHHLGVGCATPCNPWGGKESIMLSEIYI